MLRQRPLPVKRRGGDAATSRISVGPGGDARYADFAKAGLDAVVGVGLKASATIGANSSHSTLVWRPLSNSAISQE